jgi:protein AATF/BFR2
MFMLFIGLTHLSRYHAHLTRTLGKWSAKVVAVAPSALLPASRKRFSLTGSTKETVKSVGTQIEDMLQGEWPALLSRTRLKRCGGSRVTREAGREDNGFEEDEGVFDDTDFYQQLLRDVIDSKGRGSGQVTDWTANQKQKKLKKVVDTRASKGRKLRFVMFSKQTQSDGHCLMTYHRYEVHEKIQNFMVPVPLGAGAWHEAQIDELFASLLGKGYTMAEAPNPPGKAADALRGFRLFG